jgi:hypothetical protein
VSFEDDILVDDEKANEADDDDEEEARKDASGSLVRSKGSQVQSLR